MPGTRPPPHGGVPAVTVLRLAALVMVLAIAAPLMRSAPAAASSRWITAEQRFTNLMNDERAQRGLPTMRANLQMLRVARDWSATMARRDELSHRAELSVQVHGPWQRLGENVGRMGLSSQSAIDRAVDTLHAAFMDSPGHRANVLGDYNQVGVGVHVDGGDLWVTFNFLKGPHGAFPLFADIGANPHRASIESAWLAGAVSGCTFDRYCPGRPVSRAQMASFIGRAVGLTPALATRFRDVDPGSPHAGYINAVAAAEIASGCGDGRYCPEDRVSRGQMATFLARGVQLASSTSPSFVDVPPINPHYGNINAVAEEAITSGCDTTGARYCPDRAVQRDQMASFVSRAFGLTTSFWEGSGQDVSSSSATADPDADVDLGEPVNQDRTASGS